MKFNFKPVVVKQKNKRFSAGNIAFLAATVMIGLPLTLTHPAQAQEGAATTTQQPSTFARFVPERMDDFAWENDLVAFRVYGPGIKASGEGEDSGIDCWLKRVPYPIINKWYEGELKNKISYHADHGEGLDAYNVGGSRGCGGTAIWKDGQMIRSGSYKTWKIISQEPAKTVFELNYEYKVGDDTIKETKRITIELGKRLFDVKSTFTKDSKPAVGLDIAVGITTHENRATATLNAKEGWMACWEKIGGQGLGTGVVMAPSQIVEMREVKSTTKDQAHALLLTKTNAAGEVEFSTGYGWEKAGVIITSELWQAYLSKQAALLTPAQ